MSYHFEYILREMGGNLAVFKQLLQDTNDMALWRPSPEKWCLLELVCHLYDEEREDFRFYIEEIFAHPGQTLTPINLADDVKSRKYIQQNYGEMLAKFFSQREASLMWIRERVANIPTANWDCIFRHPEMGEISAYCFLENWLGHDYLHIRQLFNIKLEYLSQMNCNSLDYARG